MEEEKFVESPPRLIDKERAEVLLKKWSKVLDFTKPISEGDCKKRLATAILIESQEMWHWKDGEGTWHRRPPTEEEIKRFESEKESNK